MAASVRFVLERAEMTRAAQESVAADWTWPEKTLEGWTTEIAAVKAKDAEASGLEHDLDRARGGLDASLRDLHDLTAQGLGMARSKYRKDETTLALLRNLDARGDSRNTILDEAEEWSRVWQRLPDPDWNPTPENTRTSFAALLQAAQKEMAAMKQALVDARKARKEFNAQLGDLWEDCVAWYNDATLVFPESTPNGEVVRKIPHAVAHAAQPPEPVPAPAP